MTTTLTATDLAAYAAHLKNEERSPGTIDGYLRHLRAFACWLGDRPLSKETATAWKAYLLEIGYKATTINNKLAALNSFLGFVQRPDCRVKPLRVQRQLFREESRQLSRQDYEILLTTARRRGQKRLALIMETLCATGIRVSELSAITVHAARRAAPTSPSKVRCAPYFCRANFAANSARMPEHKKSPPARFFSPMAEGPYQDSKSGPS